MKQSYLHDMEERGNTTQMWKEPTELTRNVTSHSLSFYSRRSKFVLLFLEKAKQEPGTMFSIWSDSEFDGKFWVSTL